MTIVSENLPLSVLDNWLFGVADILRGPIDAADFKTYIVTLLFYKRICDAYDEEFGTEDLPSETSKPFWTTVGFAHV